MCTWLEGNLLTLRNATMCTWLEGNLLTLRNSLTVNNARVKIKVADL